MRAPKDVRVPSKIIHNRRLQSVHGAPAVPVRALVPAREEARDEPALARARARARAVVRDRAGLERRRAPVSRSRDRRALSIDTFISCCEETG